MKGEQKRVTSRPKPKQTILSVPFCRSHHGNVDEAALGTLISRHPCIEVGSRRLPELTGRLAVSLRVTFSPPVSQAGHEVAESHTENASRLIFSLSEN